MPTLGGTIRLGELVGDQPIRHAIKVNPWAERFLHYSPTIPGYKWPARAADSYAADGYNRAADPAIVMGSLFAIPPDVAVESLDLQTVPARKLFYVMQNYGVYFAEDAAWDTWDMVIERDVEIEFEDTYGFSLSSNLWRIELNKLMKALYIILNNGPETIGGGGEPRVPMAEPLSATRIDQNTSVETQ
jgi:hypothetical protein